MPGSRQDPGVYGDAQVSRSPQIITYLDWEAQYAQLEQQGVRQPTYGGPLSRHVADGDLRLPRLRYDNSPAALQLWNFLLTEEDRLRDAQARGRKIVGTMKDLGTVPVMAYSLPEVTAFYPDGAWWIPCVMELSSPMMQVADSLGIDDSFCPVRAMLGAFLTRQHFPLPDLLVCSAGATCDDFSAIAQRLEAKGFPIFWWEIPHRRPPEVDEPAVALPGGFTAPRSQVEFVASELLQVKQALEALAGRALDDASLGAGIRQANIVRRTLRELRQLVCTATPCPLPSLELLIAEMLAIHFCSDREETISVLTSLLAEVKGRINTKSGVTPVNAVRVFWVNPVADLRAMNLLEECGGRICGTDFMFSHALDLIPEVLPPLEALALMALADPMVGATRDRGQRICRDIQAFGAEAVVISRIPGGSHCAFEGICFSEMIRSQCGIPTVEIEVPPVCDAMLPTLRTRLQALVEMAISRRIKGQD
jgi:benzoyl-CoA reductase/2-hydroxyglutaryl-CoA dehydratase subunit BcrC/BadD/HgdB